MTSRTANKIKQRRESFKENQTPVVVRKPNKELFSLLAGTSVVVIIFLSYLGYYRSDFTNELIIPIIVAVTVLLLLIIWYLPKFYVRSLPIETGKDFDREKERLKLEDDTRKTFAQIVGGIVFLGGLIFTYNTFRLQQEGQFTDRFTKAVAQLGDDKLEIRLGGLYALERIAKDSPKDHWTVMEILSAYIRESTKKKEEIAENNSNKPANVNVNETKKNEKITTDIQAALTIVGRRKIEQDSKTDKINLSGANLNRSNLNGSNLRKADLREANLIEASLREASLREADLFGADLGKADLRKADLSGAHLFIADLKGADLASANLSETLLLYTNLSKAFLYKADLSGADLFGADLIGANLSGANLIGANLREANLSGANLRETNLREAENLTFEQLGNAVINEITILPDYLESRKAELLEISKRKSEEEENLFNETNKK